MSKIDTNIIKDGQLSVATVAQTGELITDPSVVDTTALVQTDNGPQLAVKTFSVGGGGGGGASFQTAWIGNKSGQTFDISSLGAIKEVYRNGKLLQEGSSITGRKFIGGSGKWLQLAQTAPISTADSWSFRGRFLTGATHPMWGCLLGGSGTQQYQAPQFGYNASYNTIKANNGSTGSSWDIYDWEINYTLSPNQEYDLVLGFAGSYYFFMAKQSAEQEYTKFFKTSSVKSYCSVPWTILNMINNSYPSNAGVYMPTVKIEINGELWFDGGTAVEGTDYTNNNCTEETYQTTTNGYAISGSSLVLAEPLYPQDTLAIVYEG